MAAWRQEGLGSAVPTCLHHTRARPRRTRRRWVQRMPRVSTKHRERKNSKRGGQQTARAPVRPFFPVARCRPATPRPSPRPPLPPCVHDLYMSAAAWRTSRRGTAVAVSPQGAGRPPPPPVAPHPHPRRRPPPRLTEVAPRAPRAVAHPPPPPQNGAHSPCARPPASLIVHRGLLLQHLQQRHADLVEVLPAERAADKAGVDLHLDLQTGVRGGGWTGGGKRDNARGGDGKGRRGRGNTGGGGRG